MGDLTTVEPIYCDDEPVEWAVESSLFSPHPKRYVLIRDHAKGCAACIAGNCIVRRVRSASSEWDHLVHDVGRDMN